MALGESVYLVVKMYFSLIFRANGADTSSLGGSTKTGDDYLEMTLLLKRGDSGFGFRIVGGEEEGSQVLMVESGTNMQPQNSPFAE